jgi:hypothetical protein
VGLWAHSDGRRTIFLDTCCCYTHGAGQCGYRVRCRFSCTHGCNAYCWFSDGRSDEELEPVFQEPITNHEEEEQEPPIQDVLHNEPPRRSQRARRLAISDDYEVYVSEEIQMEGDPTSFEEAMRNAYSSKWL